MFGSIYGLGVLNDTVVPGYGVTKAPVNLSAFWALPNGTIRAFAEENQYVTYPQGYPSIMYALAQNFTDSNHISQLNPMCIGMNFTDNTTNSLLTNKGQYDAYEWGRNLRIQHEIQSTVQGIAQALSSMESSLSNVLQSDKLTSAQKAELKGLLEEVKVLKEQIAKQLKDENPTLEEITAMQKEVQDLQKKVSEAATKLQEELNGTPVSNNSDNNSTETRDEDLADTEYKDVNPKTGKSSTLSDPADGEAEEFCAAIDRAIKGAGTDEDALREILPGITANNVLEIVNQWKDTRRGNLFGELLDDLNDAEQQELIPILLNALKERASALGIYDEINIECSKINQELAAKRNCINWMWGAGQDDSVIEANLLAICEKIEAKEKANKEGASKVKETKKSESDKKASEAKAEKKQKAEERKTEVIAEKKSEFAKVMKDALKLDEIPELSSALKVETDEQGEFTTYSIKIRGKDGEFTLKGTTYNQLVLNLEKHGLKPEVLMKKDIKA